MTTTMNEVSGGNGNNSNNNHGPMNLNDDHGYGKQVGDTPENSKVTILSTGITPEGTKYHVRRMRLDDIDEVLKVWKEIGLYEGTNTIQSFLTIDPEGFFVAVNDSDGSIIGEVGAVFVDPETAFVGLYAVRPDFQKKGVGLAVWKQMMNHVGDKNVGLYAIEDQYDTYRNKAKLEIEDTVKMIEYSTKGSTSTEILSNLIQSVDNVDLVEVTESNSEVIKQIIKYDQSISGSDRGHLLPLIISEPDALCLAAIERSGEANGSVGLLRGYGIIHTTNIDRALLGPVFAQSRESAELLIGQLIDRFPMAKTLGYSLMAPDCNTDYIAIVTKLKCQRDHILPRLFRHFCPKVNWSQVYSITSPNYTTF